MKEPSFECQQELSSMDYDHPVIRDKTFDDFQFLLTWPIFLEKGPPMTYKADYVGIADC